MKKIAIITLEPDFFKDITSYSILKKSLDKKIWSLEVINIRQNNEQVDDECFGGGPGMLLKADPIHRAIQNVSFIKEPNKLLIHMAPRGYLLNHEMSRVIANNSKNIVILCSRFEGVDQRVIDHWGFIEISIGNFILTNGDIAAAVFLDSVIRMIDNVVGNKESIENESFEKLKYDQYTRPFEWNGIAAPEVLRNGNHKKIKDWRDESSTKQTLKIKKNNWLDFVK